ncbi:hypothetical protein AKO1_007209 [Acrasis kona]|uniref:Biogenesis of lysosome-related organelles complex 1 subunit 2 n=1 Tax=Acrasis kona TaxID=1008807 RepID=A0AAW2YRX6_9EUKA
MSQSVEGSVSDIGSPVISNTGTSSAESPVAKGSYRERASSSSEPSSPFRNDTKDLHTKVEILFQDVASVVHGEMQAGFNELTLLENINAAVGKRYEVMSGRTQNVLETITKMKEQYALLQPFFDEIDQIDQSVNELSNTVKYLDSYTKNLETSLREFL